MVMVFLDEEERKQGLTVMILDPRQVLKQEKKREVQMGRKYWNVK
ncbi:hypothetical protein AAYR32_08175 [Streptococcus agalactiae]